MEGIPTEAMNISKHPHKIFLLSTTGLILDK